MWFEESPAAHGTCYMNRLLLLLPLAPRPYNAQPLVMSPRTTGRAPAGVCEAWLLFTGLDFTGPSAIMIVVAFTVDVHPRGVAFSRPIVVYAAIAAEPDIGHPVIEFGGTPCPHKRQDKYGCSLITHGYAAIGRPSFWR